MSEEEIRKKRAFVWGWGKNKNGELSLGVTKDAVFPRLIKGLNGKVIVFISSGANHSAAITSDGELIVCGSYLHDKLGIEDLRATNVLKFIPSTFMKGLIVKKVAWGDYHTLCLLEDGSVHSWGGTLHKKLGKPKDAYYPLKVPMPYLIESLLHTVIIDIAWGDFHSMALDEDGRLYTWGGGGASYNKGQWGHGDENDEDDPKFVEFFDGVRIK